MNRLSKALPAARSSKREAVIYAYVSTNEQKKKGWT
jgi:hypothetical protein